MIFKLHPVNKDQVLLDDRTVYGILNPIYLEWIAEGNMPLPADLPTAQQQRDVIQSQINTLESAPVYMNRFVREWAIKAAVIEAAKVGATEPMLYASSKGYRDIKDLDTLITSLRFQMNSIVG